MRPCVVSASKSGAVSPIWSVIVCSSGWAIFHGLAECGLSIRRRAADQTNGAQRQGISLDRAFLKEMLRADLRAWQNFPPAAVRHLTVGVLHFSRLRGEVQRRPQAAVHVA